MDEIIESFCKKLIETFSRKSYLPASYLSNEIISEIVFWYLDCLAEHCPGFRDGESVKTCYIDKSIPLEKVIKLWKAMSDAVVLHYDSLSLSFDPESTLLIDPLKDSETFLDKHFGLALEHPVEHVPCNLEFSGVFPYRFIESVINEANDRGLSEIVRPWHKPEGENAIKEYEECGIRPQIFFWYTMETYYKELEKLIGLAQQAYRYAIRAFSREARLHYRKTGTNVFYLQKTRDSGIKILHLPGGQFATSFTYEEAPSDPLACGADSFTVGAARLDFTKAPLYSSLEYFLIEDVCKYHNVHCVLLFGEHIGSQFRSK